MKDQDTSLFTQKKIRHFLLPLGISLVVQIGMQMAMLVGTLQANTDLPIAMISSYEGEVVFGNSTERQIDFGTDIFLGDMINTKAASQVSITFYNGCRQEVVGENSSVQVGPNQSQIRSGKFTKVEKTPCDIPQAVLANNDSHLKAGLVVRNLKPKDKNSRLEKYRKAVPSFVKDKQIDLKLWSNKGPSPEYKIGDKMVFHFVSQSDAYVLMDYYSSDGSLHHLSNDLRLQRGKVMAGKLYSLGNRRLDLRAGAPSGVDFIKILVSQSPFPPLAKDKDAYIAGLKADIAKKKQSGLLAEYDMPIFINK